MTSARTTLTAGAAAAMASLALMACVTVIVGAQLGFDLWPALGRPSARLLEVPAVSPTGAGTNPLLPASNPLGGAIGTLAGGAGAPAFAVVVTGAAALNATVAVLDRVARPTAATDQVAAVRSKGRRSASGIGKGRVGARPGTPGRKPTVSAGTAPPATAQPATPGVSRPPTASIPPIAVIAPPSSSPVGSETGGKAKAPASTPASDGGPTTKTSQDEGKRHGAASGTPKNPDKAFGPAGGGHGQDQPHAPPTAGKGSAAPASPGPSAVAGPSTVADKSGQGPGRDTAAGSPGKEADGRGNDTSAGSSSTSSGHGKG